MPTTTDAIAARWLLAPALAAALLAPAARADALCADATGDGFVTAVDALATLKLAVAGAYERRSDVKPPGGDGKVTAADALVTLFGAIRGEIPACAGVSSTRVVVTTAPSDFSSGGAAVVDVATRAFSYRGGATSSDSVIRVPAGHPLVVNRKQFNSIQEIDFASPVLPTRKECSVSDGIDSNPQDVVLLSPIKGYVTLYDGPRLLVIDPRVAFDPKIDPACNGLVTGRIDLSTYDADGLPQMDQMALVGERLFVSMQALDGLYEPKQSGRVAVIDTNQDRVEAMVELAFANPFAATKGIVYDERQAKLFLAGPGRIATDLDDGGLEALDPQSLETSGLLLSGKDVGGDLFDFVVAGSRRILAIVADATANRVVDVDLASRSVRDVLLTSTELISDIELNELGELWVAFREDSKTADPGIRIFEIGANRELTDTPIALGQAPFTVAFAD